MSPARFTRRGLLGGLAGGAAAIGAVGAAGFALGDSRDDPAPQAGGSSPFQVGAVTTAASGRTREYWVQVDSFEHDLVPSGRDDMMGTHLAPTDGTFWALGYRAYTPEWGRPLAGDDDIGPNTGIPGPVLRGEVGDTIRVHFRNNDSHYRWPHSMHPHGVSYTPDNDGGYVAAQPDVPGRAVAYGDTYTYTWTVKPSSVGTWPYHDHSVAQGDAKGAPVMELGAELGMFGVLALTDAATPRVDRELVLFFHDLYQSDVPTLSQDFDCFNGAAYLGNTPTFTARTGERVRWRVAALGREFHVFHLHGHRWKAADGSFIDSQVIGPSTATTIEYTEDNVGDWLYHCHVTDHMNGGMVGWYRVSA